MIEKATTTTTEKKTTTTEKKTTSAGYGPLEISKASFRVCRISFRGRISLHKFRS